MKTKMPFFVLFFLGLVSKLWPFQVIRVNTNRPFMA